jgi:hypothetical protein
MVEILTGSRPVDWGWLWSEHNGHRIPFPKLVLLALYRLSGSDFRVGMYFNAVGLAALAAGLILLARRLRERTASTDAFFPILLLSWAHYENLLWTWQVTQIVAVILAGIALIVMTRVGLYPTGRAAIVAGAVLVLLPLSGAPGIAYVPGFSIWVALAAAMSWFRPDGAGRGTAVVLGVSTVAALILTASYFVGYREIHRVKFHPRGWLLTPLHFVASAFGPGSALSWALSDLAIVALSLATAVLLVREARSQNSRAIALLCFLGGSVLLAASAGIGRPGYGFGMRYAAMAAPGVCAVYLAWIVCQRGAAGSRVQAGLFALAVLGLPFAFVVGWDYAQGYHEQMEAFRSDLASGTPAPVLVVRYAPTLCPCPWPTDTYGIVLQPGPQPPSHSIFPPQFNCVSFHPWLLESLLQLHRAGIRYFRFLRDDAPVMDTRPVDGRDSGGIASRLRIDPQRNLIVNTGGTAQVYGLRIRSQHGGPAPGSSLQVFWSADPGLAVTHRRHYVHYWLDGQTEYTIWMFEQVTAVIVNMDNDPRVRDLLELALLVPPTK